VARDGLAQGIGEGQRKLIAPVLQSRGIATITRSGELVQVEWSEGANERPATNSMPRAWASSAQCFRRGGAFDWSGQRYPSLSRYSGSLISRAGSCAGWPVWTHQLLCFEGGRDRSGG
jgi:hypothetical protein